MCTWRLLCGVWVGNGTHGFCRSFIVCGVVDLFATGSSFDRSEAYLYINNDDIYIIHVDRRQNLTTTTIIKKTNVSSNNKRNQNMIWFMQCLSHQIGATCQNSYANRVVNTKENNERQYSINGHLGIHGWVLSLRAAHFLWYFREKNIAFFAYTIFPLPNRWLSQDFSHTIGMDRSDQNEFSIIFYYNLHLPNTNTENGRKKYQICGSNSSHKSIENSFHPVIHLRLEFRFFLSLCVNMCLRMDCY